MIETNLSEFQNFTPVIDLEPMKIVGSVNGTPVDLQVSGNVTTMAHVNGIDIIIQLLILDTVLLIIFLILFIVVFVKYVNSKNVRF